ncbi:MAG: urea carboxylase [Ethanoligenens sp.]
MFNKVLIANRGAIACRIERTLKNMGISSVAVYTKADQDSLHVSSADEAICIGEGPARDSYLNADLILKTAVITGAQAIHPGYGFLSENADFARKCAENNIAFIGPTPEQIEIFGLKHSARTLAKKAGVPLPMGTGLLKDVKEAVKCALEISYPVMLKSTAGGGGIGMRVCNSEEELQKAFESVGYLAGANFGNSGLFLEKYIARARHIEVQIFGSASGEVVAIGERDCSVQRRNQKVMEETPAPNLPESVRKEMHLAAVRFAKLAHYRSAGTVEFLYDKETKHFSFLEVNTRLQVEHGVTEEVYGIDLVEWMILEAAGEIGELAPRIHAPNGHSIQARIYAEDSNAGFIPCTGHIDGVSFSDLARVETWIEESSEVTALYDPMLAKIIAHGKDREEARAKLEKALNETKIYGVTCNLPYLSSFIARDDYKSGDLFTHMLDGFIPEYPALEVLDGGVQTTVQDYPARIGYWNVGVPPSGPMDMWSFRAGNLILGNDSGAPGLELTLRGGKYRFRGVATFCLAGADMQAALDGKPVALYEAITAKAGQILTFGEAKLGMRAYLLLQGGLDMPLTLGSASTFTLGVFGGYNGCPLITGDILPIKKQENTAPYRNCTVHQKVSNEWVIGVIPGPHCTTEFLDPDYLKQLIDIKWEIHFNSSRTGVRLVGPTPQWTRMDGGEAGLHPSNIHDTPYALGALDMTGDMPILLGPDGPSLGGFVCPVTVATAELWKVGQLHPGDTVEFKLISVETAEQMRNAQEELFARFSAQSESTLAPADLTDATIPPTPDYPIFYSEHSDVHKVVLRCSGDQNLLVEFGEMELNLRLRFKAHLLMQAIQKDGTIPIIDLTPGIRSLQVHINPDKINMSSACKKLIEIIDSLPPLESVKLPSRVVKLPVSWNDPKAQLAMQRYQQGVRPDAPWCPDNIEFIRRINGLESIQSVKDIIFDATYLVMGLGDVYLGAPVAVPLDPRHRLVTTKYNPARTWTPENAVGIGGAYLCVYGVEGPGGYQLFGRTVQMWNRMHTTPCFEKGKPWLLRFFDQIQFYPVSPDELLANREAFLRGRFTVEITETTFDLGEYLKHLDSIKDEAAAAKNRQQASFNAERERWKATGVAEFVSEQTEAPEEEEKLPDGATPVNAQITGSIWKVLVTEGEHIEKGQTLVIMESMKMEFAQQAVESGTVGKIFVKPGEVVHNGHTLLYTQE